MKKIFILTGLVLISVYQTSSLAAQPQDSLNAGSPDSAINPASDTVSPVPAAKAGKPGLARKLRKSTKKAFFLSLLVPGSGEYYVEKKGYAKGFITAEAMIWSAALFNKYQGDMWRRDYISYAAQQAGSNSARTDDFYYQNVYEWPNSYWYNEDQWRQARELYPYDPAAQQIYVADKLYSSDDAWEWKDYDQWYYYRGLRVKSRNALHRISYSFGASILNHLLSAVNAARLAKRFNKQRAKITLDDYWRLECNSYRPETITLTFLRNF